MEFMPIKLILQALMCSQHCLQQQGEDFSPGKIKTVFHCPKSSRKERNLEQELDPRAGIAAETPREILQPAQPLAAGRFYALIGLTGQGTRALAKDIWGS
uniref:Uncharacterized protein n=1 Tax=Serinus canaria TaxID=9135 RepID=A0A8C9MKJ8_SERCA